MNLTRVSRFAGAPSVDYPVGRSWFYAALLAAVALAGALVLAFWWSNMPPEAVTPGWAFALWTLVAAGAVWHWLHSPQGVLRWRASGEWTWLPDSGEAQALAAPVVCLDLQARLLLRCTQARCAGPQVGYWLWVEAQRAPADWVALRRAVAAASRVAGSGGAAGDPSVSEPVRGPLGESPANPARGRS